MMLDGWVAEDGEATPVDAATDVTHGGRSWRGGGKLQFGRKGEEEGQAGGRIRGGS